MTLLWCDHAVAVFNPALCQLALACADFLCRKLPETMGWGTFGGFHPDNAWASHYTQQVLQDVEALEQDERGADHVASVAGPDTLCGMCDRPN